MTHAPHQDDMPSKKHTRLISHELQADDALETLLDAHRARIQGLGDLPHATIAQQLDLLEQLVEFELGRFLLQNRGLNAYWTHHLVTYPAHARTVDFSNDLHRLIYDSLPAVLATRERFGIFRQQLQARLASKQCLASIPCGLMGDQLMLDYTQHTGIRLLGVDLDEEALDGAQALAQERGLADHLSLRHADAWALNLDNEIDLLASNGLNIYEPDDAKVINLYRIFFKALKSGGTLVTSFMTPPPPLSAESPWKMNLLDPKILGLQQLLFTRILDAKWNVFRTHAQTRQQLETAGFTQIEFIDDHASLFPTVIASRL